MFPHGYRHQHGLHRLLSRRRLILRTRGCVSRHRGRSRANITGGLVDTVRRTASPSDSSMWPSNRPLVPVSSGHLCPYTSGLSTSSSSRGLSPARGGHPDVIFGGASRLDAFSVYPFGTWLPCGALSRTTGALEVPTTQSSRTRVVSRQVWCAHGR